MRLQRHQNSYISLPQTADGANSFILNWLNNREHLLNSLLSNLDGIVYCCLLDAQWTMLFISDGCLNLTGYIADDILNNGRISYEDITHPDDRHYVRAAIEQAVSEQRRFEIEYRVVTASGDIKWVVERGNGILNESGAAEAIEAYIQDITTRRESEIALKEAELRYRSIFENTAEGIFQTTVEGFYIRANPALANIYGYASPDALVKHLNNIEKQLYVNPDRRKEFLQLMRSQTNATNFESQVYKRDGSIIWISENSRAVYDDNGVLLYFEGTVEDITERVGYRQKIEYQATHDDLTGLPNRVMLKTRLQEAIHKAESQNGNVAVVYIDLDHFKDVNDSMGHGAGDALLIDMSHRLSAVVNELGVVARPGGDEFVLVLTELSDTNQISTILERILQVVAKPFEIGHREFVVTCSLGISLYPKDAKDSDTLLKHADAAMYEAKKVGKNNYQFFTPSINATLMRRLELEYKLRQVLKLNEFILHYQPKFSAKTRQLTGIEALIRWQSSEGLISPAEFIPVSEESNLIEHIDHWVIENACTHNMRLINTLGIEIPVSVNVSARQFYHRDFIQNVATILANTGLPPHLLEIEITESVLIDQTKMFISILNRLKAIGVKLAIDDFGTGYSNIGYLKNFPIDHLKIDQSFVRGLSHDTSNQAILSAIVVLGHHLGLNVIAEGVETEEERVFLTNIGCDEMQGFLFSKALPEDELRAFLKDYI